MSRDDVERPHTYDAEEKGGLPDGSNTPTFASQEKYTVGEDGWLFEQSFGAESRGIHPIPVEQRRNANFLGTSFIWLSANMTVAAFSTGALGPEVYGLDLRVRLFFAEENKLTSKMIDERARYRTI